MLSLPAALMVAATAAAAFAVADPARIPVVWCGGVATIVVTAVFAETVRRGRANTLLRDRHAEQTADLERRVAEYDSETYRLANEIVPSALYRLHQGEPVHLVIRAVVDRQEEYKDLSTPQRHMLRVLLRAIDQQEIARDSAQRTFVSIARRVQAIAHQQAVELREMEDDHGRNPEVFDDLLRIDHGSALIGRLADSLAVLGGGRPGRQWPEPVPLFSVLRGAMSRILEYPRIEMHSIAELGIDGTAVEPLIHAAAELMDNATRYSPPNTKVHVTAVAVQTGIAIEIEDAGVSLSDDAREQTERMLLLAREGSDLDEMGDHPRLGMAVVGRLCRMFDMQIALRQSAYGGVRAVLVVPTAMMSDRPATAFAHGIGATAVPRYDENGVLMEELARKKKRSGRRVAGPPRKNEFGDAIPDDEVPVVTEWTAGGLPQRRRRAEVELVPHGYEPPADEVDPIPIFRAGPATPNGWPVGTGPELKEIQEESQEIQEEDPGPLPGLWLEAFLEGASGKEPSGDSPGAAAPHDLDDNDDFHGGDRT
ncbi:ATP-binding protein [Streptomyces tsukubensis]|uniref:histidine kinase n=1 Tax=Streptomyces tsukubensis TaxID=83656 RepID=A0A1V4ADZ3_9ACTN|nr:ATP-binding protein [Streptomyces tsukubensis]OON82252.1 ATP-binding protein [Streptomyces tsukubensis]